MRPASDRRDELYEAYLHVAAHQRAEIVSGTLYVRPRHNPKHANVIMMLGIEIMGPFHLGRGGPGGWWLINAPELQLAAKEPVIPDLAGWRVERMPELPETAGFTIVPDWICEVLSRSTEHFVRHEKLPYYAAHGVRHVWLIDPIDQHLEVYALDAESRRWREVRIHRSDAVVHAPPFDAIEIDLAAFWSPPHAG
jgi:hypothetical protein